MLQFSVIYEKNLFYTFFSVGLSTRIYLFFQKKLIFLNFYFFVADISNFFSIGLAILSLIYLGKTRSSQLQLKWFFLSTILHLIVCASSIWLSRLVLGRLQKLMIFNINNFHDFLSSIIYFFYECWNLTSSLYTFSIVVLMSILSFPFCVSNYIILLSFKNTFKYVMLSLSNLLCRHVPINFVKHNNNLEEWIDDF